MFVPVKRLVGDVEPFERLPGAAGLSLGMAAVYSGAAGLAKCGAAAKPTHVVMGPKGADGRYPAIPVLPTTVFETESTAAVPASAIGSAVTLHTDGLTVTATTTNGVFTVSETENAADGRVRGRFGVEGECVLCVK